ncbi:MAG TPA: peptidase domain-containing ABC transporter [Rhodocyclaceae bacterium]|nr:peptidase domain-containing ABC transporter [Rhodocyclaceae bacterium]
MSTSIAARLQFGFSRQIPLIHQTESAECGLACLAMILNFHGSRMELRSLRQRFSLSLKGATLNHIMSVADTLNLAARPVRLELEELKDLQLPCILHWNFNHYVVLKRVGGDHVEINDPARGERRHSLKEVSEYFTGVALELTPKPEFQPETKKETVRLRDMTGKVIGLKRALLQIFGLAIALEVFVLVAPFFNQWIVDQAIVSGDRDLLYTLALGFGLLMLIQVSVEAVRSYVVMVMGNSLSVQWLANVFQHLVKLPIPYFERRHLGDIVSRFGSIDNIQQTLTTGFIAAILDGIMSIGLVVMMCIYNWELAMISIVAVLLYFSLRMALYGGLRMATESQIIHAARQQSMFMETVRAIQTLRVFGRTEDRVARWLNVVIDQKNCSLRTQRLGLMFRTANSLLFGIENILVLTLGAVAVMDNKFSVGMLMAFMSYKGQFATRVSGFIDRMYDFRMLRIQSARLADIALTQPEGAQYPPVAPAETIDSTIEVKGLQFRYASREDWVLYDVNFKVAAGESVAIIGPSGCGKTTLLKVLIGVMAPTKGELLIGGTPLPQLGLVFYRNKIGVVLQDDHLLSGSIGENISFFAPNHDQEWAEACAKTAAIHDDIIRLPMGYSTLIGDMGSMLSGGQRQRLLLARALYKKPAILFLDEATSHLDVANECKVSDAISALNITRIIVAHRPDTIARCDRVIELEMPDKRKKSAHRDDDVEVKESDNEDFADEREEAISMEEH